MPHADFSGSCLLIYALVLKTCASYTNESGQQAVCLLLAEQFDIKPVSKYQMMNRYIEMTQSDLEVEKCHQRQAREKNAVDCGKRRKIDLGYFRSFSYYGREISVKTELSLRKRIKCFLCTLHHRNLKTQQSCWVCV